VPWLAAVSLEGRGDLRLADEPDGVAPQIADQAGCSVLLAGEVMLGSAEKVIAAYLHEGPAVFPRLRGRFVLVVLDRRERVCYALRDPLGMHPLFYAAEGGTVYLSPSLPSVACRVGRIPRLNRLAAAAFILRTSLGGEETLLEGVQRLLQGHVLEVRDGRLNARRYWFPENESGPPNVVDELHRLLLQAVDRVVGDRAGVFLSGGLDSALVAAFLADVSRSRGLPPPVALSIALRGTDADEESMQREVAARLGLEHVVRTPAELVGPEGLMEAALALCRTRMSRPAELLVPAYDELARLGVSRGCTTIVDGSGGDEWLVPQPAYAAERLASLDLPALVELGRAWNGYWPELRPLRTVRAVVWRSGVRRLAKSLVAPLLPTRTRYARAEQRIPTWTAPDVELRRRLIERIVERTAPASPRLAIDGEKRALLDGENLSVANETAFELEARTGATSRSPLLDPDLLDLLYRVPSRRLIAGGRVKALAREALGPYLGDLVDTWPRTVYGNSLWTETIRREGHRAWSHSGGAPVLADLGIVDGGLLEGVLTRQARSPAELAAAWRALSLGSWFRAFAEGEHHL
jgi:asparagine synthase (glutamine-hydrolysing)